jgi:uracil-DNA glycosylase family 4
VSEEALTPEEMARQLRRHLESLRAAGVEWLPHAPPPEVAPARVVSTARSEPSSGLAQPEVITPSAALRMAEPESPGDGPLRRHELELLATRVAACTRCPGLASTRTQTVFGFGPLDPELCFIGEAPGADEDATGEPFVGAAGQLLNRIIAACGFKREEVYICNILRCRPPGNRQPQADEAANCREYLERQLQLVGPRYICTLGATASRYLLGVNLPIGKMRGRFYDYRGIPVVCTYHPSYILHQQQEPAKTKAKKEVWEDMKKLLTRMGRPIPNQR